MLSIVFYKCVINAIQLPLSLIHLRYTHFIAADMLETAPKAALIS